MNKLLVISMLGVLDQIGAKTYYTGRVKKAEEDPALSITEVSEDDNYDIVASSISKAASKLQGVLGIYVPAEIEYIGSADQPELLVSMDLPSNMEVSAGAALEEAIKQYCESMVLQDWYAAVSPKNAEHYAQQATLAIGDIRRAITQRKRPRF